MSDELEIPFSQQIKQFFKDGTVVLFTCARKEDFPLLSISQNTKEIVGFEFTYFLENKYGWSERIHPDDKEEVIQHFRHIVEYGGSAINEYRFKTKDGNYIWLRDELHLIDEPEADPIICGSCFDITDRKQAELALAENQQQYQTVVKHIKDVIYSLDSKGRLVFLNAQWEEQTGYSIEESYGKPLIDFVHPDDRENFENLFGNLIEGAGEDSQTEILRCLTNNGETYWAELFARRVSNRSAGRPFLVTGTLVDVTQNIVHQQEIEAVNEQLEQRVAQRSSELKKEIEKRKLAEQKLQKRLEYEKAISQCSGVLLESTSEDALERTFQILLDVTESDRVYMYKNHREDGELYLVPVAEVCNRGVTPSTKEANRRKYSDLPWWYKNLSEKKIIHSKIQDIPEPEHSILESDDVKSILVIPITVDDEWFGYLSFTDIKKKRYWPDTEISLLETAAEIIAAFEKRKLIEKSLVEQRNYTQTILDSLPSVYLLMDENLQLVQWNRNLRKYIGYNDEELGDLTAYDLIVPEEHEDLVEATQSVIADKATGAELTMLTKFGERIPYFWRGYYICLDNQQYFLCVGLDITHQKETERKLMDEKNFNEALIESLPGIFYMFDKEGHYHRWNSNFIEQLGYTSEEIEQISPDQFFEEEEFKSVKKEIEKVFKTGESEIETAVITKDGRKIPYYLTGKLFVQDGDEYLLGVGHDISEQKEARQRLKKSEEMFRNLFLKAPAAIVMVGPDNKVQSLNESFERLFGYTEDELIGKDIDQAIVPEPEYENAPKMPLNNYAMDSFQREAKRITKDGDLIDTYVAGIPVYVDDRPLAGFGMYIDITEQKKYEEEIYNSLQEKQVLLQEIHHRVKNNLAVVSGLIQLQMYETEDPVIKETLMESESRIQTMALIHEKLYRSKSLSHISCDSYIGELVETIRRTSVDNDKNISVNTDIEEVELNIDQAVPFALLINEAVTNSFKHAFDGRDEGRIQIKIYSKGGKLYAELGDNGVGLPEDFSPKTMDSLGMTLIQNFAKQLEADWEIGSDDGTYINLSFPLDELKDSSVDPLN